MQVKIEIEMTPEELRRFLGLPDVGGLQDDVITLLREKVGAATDFDATSFVKQNIDGLLNSPTWKGIAARVRLREKEEPVAPKKRSKK